MRVLVVDDDLGFLEVTTTMLRKAGHHVLCTPSSAEGIQIYRELRPDIVLLDLVMPEMDGLEALRMIRRIDPKAKVLVVSGGTVFARSFLRPAKYLGADAVLSKPFAGPELLDKIEEVSKGTVQHGEKTTFWRQRAQETFQEDQFGPTK